MKVRRKTPEATAIQWDGSKLSLTRMTKLYPHVVVNGDVLTITTLDATMRVKLGGWFVMVGKTPVGYSNEAFNERYEKVPDKVTEG